MTRKESLCKHLPLTGNPDTTCMLPLSTVFSNTEKTPSFEKTAKKAADMFHELPLALVVYGYLHPVLPEDARLRVAKRIERIYMGCLGTLIGA